jgi:putative FmdB family regulatory protein
MVLFSAEISCFWEASMPIFEYICDQCGNFFEELVLGASSAMDIICPGCQSDQVSKQFSTFASRAGGSASFKTGSAPAPAPSCNTGGL